MDWRNANSNNVGVHIVPYGNIYGTVFAQTKREIIAIEVERTKVCNSNNYDWNRSFSEPDLTDPFKRSNRFNIKHPHEFISVDDLKFFRRRKHPPDQHSRSNICLQPSDEPALPFSSLKSEYQRQFRGLYNNLRPILLRRSTSLYFKGLMQNKSEHQEQFHWYTPEDLKYCRSTSVRNSKNLFASGEISMEPEYRSSYISYPMVDRTTKILPREAFRLDPDPVEKKIHPTVQEVPSCQKLANDKSLRELAARNLQKSRLQQYVGDNKYNTAPSEYKRQFVQFPIEKAHSIPQISHIKIQGKFGGVPEYQDCFKMYDNYSKSAPIKKVDNLRVSGAEIVEKANDDTKLPEYREKFREPPKSVSKEKAIKIPDHLHPNGQFSKDIPEYYESFRDPKITQMPERGKCREPYLRLKGKIEFNPEYRNTFLDFPRSRPIIRKPASTFRLPNSSTTSNTTLIKSPKSARRKFKSYSPKRKEYIENSPITDVTTTPEYRRANYQYQLRERTPTREPKEEKGEKVVGSVSNTKYVSIATQRKSSESSTDVPGKSSYLQKRRTSRHRQATIGCHHGPGAPPSFENVVGCATKKAAKFGRRASMLQNTSTLGKDRTGYAMSNQKANDESFLVLNEPCKKSHWMKKSWYES
ncbi:PREDICTED: uncharacterized protein LOC108371991 isoform X1 [Rhagoletis zephyria]|uniref:uncharacterized protein LOC108371991 isoform X1 n=1 Tax=Rhagoletis zephyria TaxID=28612 RepID=UPI00081167E3|nr:PREDICTED: uncharacterized protein LOC108371991 isoform X1 [Rhagoletis zephyria]